MRAVLVTGSADLDSSREEVWPLLADTERINRWLGLPPVRPRPVADGTQSAARFVVDTRSAGIPTSYEEFPFEWTAGREFRVFRRMLGGPFESIRLAFRLDDREPRGARLTLELEVVPRAMLARPVAWMAARSAVSKLVKLGSEIDAHVQHAGPFPFVKPSSPVDLESLGRGLATLKKAGTSAELAERIGEWVAHMPDADCAKIRPFDVAERWKDDGVAVLRGFLNAVPAGVVELKWGIICPSCNTASEEVPSLDQVKETGHCQLCDITFDLDLDRAVEATFSPHPAVRRIVDQTFCIGGPARTPHVLSQVIVPDGAERPLAAPAEPGRYRLFARGGATASVEVADDAPARAHVEVAPNGIRPTDVRVAPAGELAVGNTTGDERHVKLERLDYATKAATAHLLSTMPDFRRLFSGELLKRETPLKVSRVAILFSDLTGSTALYTKLGDAAAFRLVDDHFDVMREAVAVHGGTVVKTMGDAVLAAFADSRQCARAAIEALTRFEAFRRAREHGELVGVKLGMHAGPCYVVTANGLLDYFGQTVNVASRVQHLAESGELLAAASVHESLDAADLEGTEVVQRFEARVKGVEEPLDLVRLRLRRAARTP